MSDEDYWFSELASMAAPIQCPGEEVVHYESLARKGLAENKWHPGWGYGWTITDAGRMLVDAQRVPIHEEIDRMRAALADEIDWHRKRVEYCKHFDGLGVKRHNARILLLESALNVKKKENNHG